MDYSELLILIDQHMNLYRKAVLKKQFDAARDQAKIINELTQDLLFLTRGM
jgi:hypothetical protein